MTKPGYRERRVERGMPKRSAAEREWEKKRRSADPEFAERRKQQRRALVARRFAEIASIKIEKGCTDCGYRGHPMALEFDHLPGFEKFASISEMVRMGRAMAAIRAEIDKCEVVCANCHRIRTAERLSGWGLPV